MKPAWAGRWALIGLSAVAAAWALSWFADAADRASRSQQDLARGRALSVQVAQSGRDRQDPAGLSVPELNLWIRQAASAASIADAPGQGVVGIEPGEPQPVSGTDLGQVLVPVRLQGVGVRQVITFLHVLGESHPAVRVQRIGMSASGDDDGLWSAEAVLAYLVPLPRDPRRPQP